MKNLNAVILAAGKGTRMCSLDQTKSKVGYEIFGKSLVNYVLAALEPLKCTEIITVVGFGGDFTKALVEEKSKVVWQHEQLGTGHAVMQATPLLQEKKGMTIILCGDTPLLKSETLQNLILTHEQNNNDLTLSTAIIANPKGYGRIVRDKNGEVVKIIEQADCSEPELQIKEVNVGVYVFDNELLLKHLSRLSTDNKQGELYLTDLIKLFKAAKLKVGACILEDNDEMIGINNRVQLAEATEILKMRINRKHMLNGVTMIDPRNTYIGPEVEIGADTIIYPNTHIYGKSVIGTANHIGPDNYLENMVTGSKNTILKSYLVNSQIGEENKIGPFAHLRDHVSIMNNCRIGNFVEIKKSTIKTGAKAAHLTYIGNSSVGERTNIGCGTITANYDGVNKFHTEIGNDVFIGSNTTIIAPLTIADKAFVAAGSTINEDVASNDFAIARARQVNKPGYAAKYRKK